MRFDILLGMISSGLIAPLALMAGGFLLAVFGIGYLLWYRRKKANAGRVIEDTPEEAPFEEAETVDYDPVPPPPAKQVGRRRSLVAGAERDDGTPSGTLQDEDVEPDLSEVEEAEFTEYEEEEGLDLQESESDLEAEPAFADSPLEGEELLLDEPAFEEPEFEESTLDEATPEEEPEWIEPSDQDLPEADLATENVGDGASDTPSNAATVGAVAAAVAGGTAATIAASMDGEAVDTQASQYEEETHAQPSREPSDIPVPAEIFVARKRPIAFRQFLPQSPGKDGLSFFGGQPIAPPEFQWPRERGSEGGAPLQFVMQWDCAQLSEADPTGLLPQDGVLYCFINCNRDPDEDFLSSHAFIHHRGSVQAWAPIAAPADAGPALGAIGGFALSGCTDQVENSDDFVPRLLPRFPFAPIAFDYETTGDGEDLYWSDESAAMSLLEIQKSGVAILTGVDDIGDAQADLSRPFAAFPHDFGAVRVIASRMIDALRSPDEFLAETLYPSHSPQERDEQFAAWREEAKEIYMLGTQRPQNQKLDQAIGDDIWQWFEERKGVLGSDMTDLIEESVDLSLGIGSEALGNVPAHWIDRAMHRHALATEFEADNGMKPGSDIRAETPARMFGPPSFAPGDVEVLVQDHILLLELPSGAGPEHHFGGCVLQYWILPDDLAAAKFDQVKAVLLAPAE